MKYFKQLLTRLSPRLNDILYFRKYHGYWANLEAPQSLDEKIQWLKLNELKRPIYTRCADKYQVRDYVKERGLEALLPPLLFVYNSPNDLIWEELPSRFVMKYCSGNGMNIICQEKSKLSPDFVRRRMKKWFRSRPHLTHAEPQYENIPKRVVVESFIEAEKGFLSPADYKVFCFHGEPYCCMLCTGRGEGMKRFYYLDRSLNRLHIERDDEGEIPIAIDRDAVLKMYEYAAELAQPFPFVRVDFYYSKGSIFFGELTFSPAGGHDRERTREADLSLGALLDLSRFS